MSTDGTEENKAGQIQNAIADLELRISRIEKHLGLTGMKGQTGGADSMKIPSKLENKVVKFSLIQVMAV
ncbi:MAG: hypothetical protein ACP5US_05380 [Candidatus Kryptoniota bacterium]